MKIYPSNSLPQAVQSGYGGANNPGLRRSEMEGGRVVQLSTTTTVRDTLNLSWNLNDVELAIFRAWHKTELAYGSESFSMFVYIGNEATNVELRIVGGVYNYTHTGFLQWNVTLEAEVFDMATISNGALLVIIDGGVDTSAFETAAASLETELGAHFNSTHPW